MSVSVFVIVRQDDNVLLLRRAHTGWKDGCWSLPAGAHDGNETLEQSAVRELREETGLEAASQDLHLTHVLHCRTGDDGSEWLGMFFLVKRWKHAPVLGEPSKHDEWGWFALDQLPVPTIDYTRQGLQHSLAGIAFSTFGW